MAKGGAEPVLVCFGGSGMPHKLAPFALSVWPLQATTLGSPFMRTIPGWLPCNSLWSQLRGNYHQFSINADFLLLPFVGLEHCRNFRWPPILAVSHHLA